MSTRNPTAITLGVGTSVTSMIIPSTQHLQAVNQWSNQSIALMIAGKVICGAGAGHTHWQLSIRVL